MIFIPRIILQSILWLLINVTFNGSTGVIGYADCEYIVNIMCYKFCCCLRINGKVISELSEKRGFNRNIGVGRGWREGFIGTKKIMRIMRIQMKKFSLIE